LNRRTIPTGVIALFLLGFALPAVLSADLEDELGRNETRLLSAPFYPVVGRTIADLALAERLDRLGYTRVRGRRPQAPGEYFWGHEVFWFYRRETQLHRRRFAPELLGLRLGSGDGVVLGFQASADGVVTPRATIWLEPERIAESFEMNRAKTERIALDDLPEHVWRAVLALEDHRFFEHSGVDPRSVARAIVTNTKSGGVVQGGSTITQQLIKIRDLTPQRKFRRKASEAIRAVALEQQYEKREILQAYLNAVYYGHIDGLSIYGIGTAARAYYGKSASDLSLSEAAVLAAMVQAPNRLNPQRPKSDLRERYEQALSRLVELGWVESAAADRSRRAGLPPVRIRRPNRASATHLRRWVQELATESAPKRSEKGKGFVGWTTIDPILQSRAETALEESLRDLRRRSPSVSGALVSIDSETGAVLAYVGGDPAQTGDRFDRVRSARRQPGSTVKPIVLLEAFDRCGDREALYPARRVADRSIRLEIDRAPDWEPQNSSGRFYGDVTLAQATVDSLNVPFVRTARWCGFGPTADRFRRAGLTLESSPPPSFVLGAVEVSPLELATAYSAIAGDGRRRTARPLDRLSRSSGRSLRSWGPKSRRVVDPATAYLVRDLLEQTVREGTAQEARLSEEGSFGKTGTSSDRRDAWFVGGHGAILTVVWIGSDKGTSVGLTGGGAAAPVWRRFMSDAIKTRSAPRKTQPEGVVTRWVEESTGLLTGSGRRGSRPYLFRRGQEPSRRRIWRSDAPIPVIE